jgi:hypothetical protein
MPNLGAAVHVRRVAYGPRHAARVWKTKGSEALVALFRCPGNTIVRARLKFGVSPSHDVMQLGHTAQSLGLAGAQSTCGIVRLQRTGISTPNGSQQHASTQSPTSTLFL